MTDTLTKATLARAVADLTARDPDLAAIVDRYGPPPLWARPPGFETLTHIILEQQVSLASARAALERLLIAADPLTPEAFLRLDDAQLLAIGFSRQKARYVRLLAGRLIDGSFDFDALETADDATARAALLDLTGIGPWTADIYLLMVLLRPDAWPVGDVALQTAAQDVKRLAARPDHVAMEALAEPWRPWRAVAARLLWHDYLGRRGRS